MNTVAAYNGLEPAFAALFRKNGGDWTKFYQAVEALGKLPPYRRREELRKLSELTAATDKSPRR